MRKQTLFLSLILCVSAIIMAMPASAAEVTITFDDHNPSLRDGQTLTNQYSDKGVTFSGTKVVDTNPSQSVTDLGIAPINGFCRIDFNPYVTSVTMDFEDAASGVMAGVTVNGKPVADFEWSANGNTLQVSSSTSNPITVVAVTSLTNVKKIQFDNLRYTQVPEFPTVVVPVAAVLGLLFIFQRRKN